MRHRTIVRTTAAIAATIAAASAIGACTASGASGGKVAANGVARPQAAGAAAASSAAAIGSAASAPTAAAGARQDAYVLGTAKIRTAELNVVIAHGTSLAARADDAETMAVQVGGEVDADDRSDGKDASATIVLKVPPVQLDTTLNRLARLGKEKSRHLSTEDVTAKVADVTSRVASAQQAITRLRVLYTHAAKVADVIAIESELSSRESDLESLQAQQLALSTETSMATITVTLTSAGAPLVKKKAAHHRTGFVGGLQNGWDAFTGAAVALATGLGAALPFLAVALILAFAARMMWTRIAWTRTASTRTRRRQSDTPTPQE